MGGVDGFNALLGLNLAGAQDGAFVVTLEADARHLHEQGTVHGGVLLALLDTAMARAARAHCPAGHYAPTLDLQAHFLRPASPGRLTARARVRHAGRRRLLVAAEVHDPADRLIATATATLMPTPLASQCGADHSKG
ncbi:PaaI family thioesterase [Parapedomonas caeni]